MVLKKQQTITQSLTETENDSASLVISHAIGWDYFEDFGEKQK